MIKYFLSKTVKSLVHEVKQTNKSIAIKISEEPFFK